MSKDSIESSSWLRESIFKKAFEGNNLEYLKSHSFRHSMDRNMKKMPNAVELSIALAENDGHKSGMCTLHASYGGDYSSEQSRLMRGFLLE